MYSYNVSFSTDGLRFVNGEIRLYKNEENELQLIVKNEDIVEKLDTICIRNCRLTDIDDKTVSISIKQPWDYFYDHHRILRKKFTLKLEKLQSFKHDFEILKKETENYKYYKNGTLRSKKTEYEYTEYYNDPGYKIRYKGKRDDDGNYAGGTFYNERQNIQIDFDEIENNRPKGKFSIFLYDEEDNEIYYETKSVYDDTDLMYLDVDIFAEENIIGYNDIINRSESEHKLLLKILDEIYEIKQEIKHNKKTGWFS